MSVKKSVKIEQKWVKGDVTDLEKQKQYLKQMKIKD